MTRAASGLASGTPASLLAADRSAASVQHSRS